MRRAFLALGVVAIAAAVLLPGAFGGARGDSGRLGQDRSRSAGRSRSPGRRRATRRSRSGCRRTSATSTRRRTNGKRGVFGRQIVFKAVRRRVQPGEHGAEDEAARRAGSRLRARRRPRHRAAGGGHRVRQPAEGAADLRLHRRDRVGRPRQARVAPVHDRLAARLPGRGGDLRPVHRRRTCRARRSGSSTRTTATAGTTSTASRPGSARTRARSSASRASRSPTRRSRTRCSRCAGPASTR